MARSAPAAAVVLDAEAIEGRAAIAAAAADGDAARAAAAKAAADADREPFIVAYRYSGPREGYACWLWALGSCTSLLRHPVLM